MRTIIHTSLFVFAVASSSAPMLAFQNGCADVESRQTLNVMTVNPLFSEIRDRTLRLDRIAQYAAARASDPIDIILVQESVRGVLALTSSSGAQELRALLANKGL